MSVKWFFIFFFAIGLLSGCQDSSESETSSKPVSLSESTGCSGGRDKADDSLELTQNEKDQNSSDIDFETLEKDSDSGCSL